MLHIQVIKIIIPDFLQQDLTVIQAAIKVQQVGVAVAAAQPILIQAAGEEEYLDKDSLEVMQTTDLHTLMQAAAVRAAPGATEYQPP